MYALALEIVDDDSHVAPSRLVKLHFGRRIKGIGPNLKRLIVSCCSGFSCGRMKDPLVGDAFETAANFDVDGVGSECAWEVEILRGHYR